MNDVILYTESLLAKSELTKAIEFLRAKVPSDNNEIQNELVLLQSMNTTVDKNERLRLVDQNSIQQEKQRLTLSLLSVMKVIENTFLKNEKKKVNKKNYYFEIDSNKPKFFEKRIGLGLSLILLTITVFILIRYDELDLFYAGTSIVLIIAIVLNFRVPNFATSNRKYELNLSLDSGIYGGLIGGSIAGVFIALYYYFSFLNDDSFDNNKQKFELFLNHSTLVVPFCAVSGIVIGAVSIFSMNYLQKLSLLNWKMNFIIGGILGTTLGALILGMLGAKFFASGELPLIEPPIILVIATIFTSFSIAIGLLLYSYRGNFKYIFSVLLTLFVIILVLLLIMYFVFKIPEVDNILKGLTGTDERGFKVIKAGALFGIILGIAGGSLIPLTIIFYKSWHYAEIQRLKEIKNTNYKDLQFDEM